jgi:hypothetical protein
VSSEWEKVALEWLDRLNIGSDDSPQRWGEVVRLAALLAETHAAGKREGIEASAKVADGCMITGSAAGPLHFAGWRDGVSHTRNSIRALLQTEARAETGEGKRKQ